MSRKDIGTLAKHANNIRNIKLNSNQRSNIASIAAKARWVRYRKRQDHTCTDMCRCVCGKPKYRHATEESLKEFRCTSW